MFGNVFGNTIHSASLVVAIFMLGLGTGSYVVGAWADRRYASQPDTLLRAYGYAEVVIAALGAAIALVLPHLGQLSALISSYSQEPSGWYALSAASYLARGAIAILLLTPITLLMGGTLTLLIRHLVRSDVAISGWRIALLYAVNTAGAALGALATDFALIPSWGLWGAQMVAVFFNVVAGGGALALANAQVKRGKSEVKGRKKNVRSVRLQPDRAADVAPVEAGPNARPVVLTSIALAMTGLAAMGMEILWFRHFLILLGGFRAVFSLLLAVILAGIGIGSLVGGYLDRRRGHPTESFMLVQGVFVASTLLGFATADVHAVDAAAAAAEQVMAGSAGVMSTLEELWFNARPMLVEVALPALLMGFSFPLANAIIQRAELSVGRRAGVLYLANTAGAVCGSLATGFVLLPLLGLQHSATVLMLFAAGAIVPLYFSEPREPAAGRRALAASLAIAAAGLVIWVMRPADLVIQRALGLPKGSERVLTIDDGLTEVIAVTEVPTGRTLVTNGHAMSSTMPMSQRYMRSLAHIPLLSMDAPQSVLVIGFGVGNSTQAATLHPTVTHVDLADLSRDILAHADYFAGGNKDVLHDPKLTVYINDGRQHLQMRQPASYDLITLEPPPIAYAGVGALYSKEFYALARTRLKPGGYISQWLPAYQVPPETTLSMVRAFIDVFPQAVLLSGAESDLVLLGINGDHIEIDPGKVAAALNRAPAVQADLARVQLGTLREIVGTFVGSARTLAEATRDAVPVTDDRPMQEYGVRSMLNFFKGVPTSVADLDEVGAWCPRCFANGAPVPQLAGLDTYLELMKLAYAAPPAEVARAKQLADKGRVVAGSSYLAQIVPESADTHNVLGIDLARGGRIAEAIAEFRLALSLDPNNAATNWHLGAALASTGANGEAIAYLRRSVQLDPSNSEAQSDLGLMLAQAGLLDEATQHFEQALRLDPQSEDAQRNLALIQQQRGR
jgi:spermidine synthase